MVIFLNRIIHCTVFLNDISFSYVGSLRPSGRTDWHTVCYRSATEYVTRKLTEEWYNIIILLNVVAIIKPTNCDRSCAVSAKSWSWSLCGLGDLEAASHTEVMVEVIVSNVLMSCLTC